MAKQVMLVTGHKSILSLTIYQKVCEDDELSMGISLAYSLLHPSEVSRLQDIIDEEQKALETIFEKQYKTKSNLHWLHPKK